MALTGDELLKLADDIETREVEIPDRGTVYVRGLSGKEREAWEASNRRLIPKPSGGFDVIPQVVGMEARLLVRALVDEDGKRLFTDKQADAVSALPSKISSKLFDAAREVSGIGDDDVEEMAKNSDADPSGDSSSI